MTDDKRLLIMRAAEKLFTSRRVHEITLDDVVQEARVGKGTVYRYFKDKDDLFFQVALSGFDELCELVRSRVSGEAPFESQLLSACVSISAFFQGRRQLFRMIQAEDARMYWCRGPARQQWYAKRKDLAAALAVILERGVGQGVIRADIPCAVLASFLLSMLRSRARELEDTPEAARTHELIVDLFCHGAGARPREAPAPPAG